MAYGHRRKSEDHQGPVLQTGRHPVPKPHRPDGSRPREGTNQPKIYDMPRRGSADLRAMKLNRNLVGTLRRGVRGAQRGAVAPGWGCRNACASIFAKATLDRSLRFRLRQGYAGHVGDGASAPSLPHGAPSGGAGEKRRRGRKAAARAKSAARARAGFCQALASSSLLDASARERGCGWRSFR
jgi:hypothetical protein